MEKRIDKLESKVDLIMENHLPHISESISEISVSVEKVNVNVEWLMKFFFIFATAVTGTFITVLGIIMTRQ